MNLSNKCKIINGYLSNLDEDSFIKIVDSELYCMNFIDNKDYLTIDDLKTIYRKLKKEKF
jgi:hypothetical protein